MEAKRDQRCCLCCFKFIITMGLTALFLWLSLRVDEPKCYIQSIYVPALNKSLNSPQNSTVFFALKLKNPNKEKGIKYDDVHLFFAVFNASNTTRPLANSTVDSFYQGHQKNALKSGNATVVANMTVAVNGKVYFRVNFTTAVKYKILMFYTKRHSLWGGANVEINDSGVKVYPKGIRLGNFPARVESGAPNFRGRYRALLSLFITVSLVVLNGQGFT